MEDSNKTVFRPVYRELDEQEKADVNAIKNTAGELYALFDDAASHKPIDGRAMALAKTKLEESVMWAVKSITG